MKIIGKTNEFDGDYIAIVKHSELQKCADKYFGNKELPRLTIGAEFNVGAGHDFRTEIKQACREMVDAMKQFERAQKTLFQFAIMVGDVPYSTVSTDAA